MKKYHQLLKERKDYKEYKIYIEKCQEESTKNSIYKFKNIKKTLMDKYQNYGDRFIVGRVLYYKQKTTFRGWLTIFSFFLLFLSLLSLFVIISLLIFENVGFLLFLLFLPFLISYYLSIKKISIILKERRNRILKNKIFSSSEINDLLSINFILGRKGIFFYLKKNHGILMETISYTDIEYIKRVYWILFNEKEKNLIINQLKKD